MRAGAILAAVLLAVSCCPDVSKRHDAGSTAATESGGGATAFAPRLSAIQAGLFDKRCVTDCHEGASAASGLVLEKGRSYSSLVGRASQQIGSALRVVPGDPDGSYLVKKLEGGKGIVGETMPRLAPRRPEAEIEAVRSWIGLGARDD